MDFVQKGTFAFFCTHMSRDAVRLCGKKWETQRDLSHLGQVTFSVPKVKEQTDVKNSNSLKTS